MEFEIRKAVKADVPRILELVKELALFEKAPEQVTNTEEQMLIDGFGENSIFFTFVAEVNGVIQGLALSYYKYSTWKGKMLYLEDLIVTEELRGEGLGKALFDKTLEIARETKSVGMTWQVLDWNESAINFYKTYGTTFDDDWVNCKIIF